MLPVVLLAVRNDRFRFTELVEHDDELASLDLLHLSRKQISHSARELVADLGPLAFSDALDDPLLRRLDRGPPKLGEVDRNLHLVADLELRILEPGLLEGDLARGVGYFFDNGLEENDSDRALALVDIDFSLHRRPVLLR